MPNVQVTTRLRNIMLTTVMVIAGSATSQAQAILDPSTWFSTGPEGDKDRQQELKKPSDTREYKPMQIGNWLVESGATVGAVFDSNLYSSRFNAKAASGVSFAPTITGRYTDGAQNTTVYLQGDARHFSTSEDVTTFGGRIGIGNSIELQRGTVWKALLQLGRGQDDSGSFSATGSGAGNTGVYVKPINSNSVFAATSVLSRIDYSQFSGFWSAGLSSSFTRFENAELSDGTEVDQSSRDTNSYTATGRLGWNVAPVVYAFVEPSVNWQETPNVTDGDTTNYRLTAGVGTDRVNLMRGELFAGYAIQSFNDLSDSEKDGFVYGGRLSWFPLRDLTFTLSGDDTLGITASSGGGSSQVYTSRTKSLAANVNYQFDRRVAASLNASFSNIDYSDTNRTDDVVRAGANVTYMVSGNLGLSLAYSNVSVSSSNDLNNVDRNIYTVGLNGRF